MVFACIRTAWHSHKHLKTCALGATDLAQAAIPEMAPGTVPGTVPKAVWRAIANAIVRGTRCVTSGVDCVVAPTAFPTFSCGTAGDMMARTTHGSICTATPDRILVTTATAICEVVCMAILRSIPLVTPAEDNGMKHGSGKMSLPCLVFWNQVSLLSVSCMAAANRCSRRAHHGP
jgi:hypothetical protein